MRFSVSPGVHSLSLFPSVNEKELLHKYNLKRLIRMASNENCYGASPHAIAAVEKASRKIHCYPDVYGGGLKEKLALRSNVNPDQIVLGNGSTELVEMIAKTFLQRNEKCLTARETFPVYRMAVHSISAICETVRLKQWMYDLQGILDAIDSNTRLIFIANPNNPTGTTHNAAYLHDFISRVPSNVLVVLDEAYREYAGEQVDLPSLPENVIVLRTFSKVYGLAGLRIGYAVCSPEVTSHLSKVSLPYGVNLMGQIAAMAALDDQEHVASCVEKNRQQRDYVLNEFLSRGYRFIPSETNFILLNAADPPSVCEKLLQKGILVAPLQLYHMTDAIRITLGLPEENQLLLEELCGINLG
ncbi:histidinol-phosphate transaminase [bacterium]|nr:histidinol-phosphate transaminase [bacterium]